MIKYNFSNQTKPKDKQDIFNRVVAWLLRPGATRCMHNNICLYRSLDGQNACAIGALIPDEKLVPVAAHKNMSLPIEALLIGCSDIRQWFNNIKDVDFLEKLQHIHDTSLNLTDTTANLIDLNKMEEELKKLALKYFLTFPSAETQQNFLSQITEKELTTTDKADSLSPAMNNKKILAKNLRPGQLIMVDGVASLTPNIDTYFQKYVLRVVSVANEYVFIEYLTNGEKWIRPSQAIKLTNYPIVVRLNKNVLPK